MANKSNYPTATELFLISTLPIAEILAAKCSDGVEIDRGRLEYAIAVSQASHDPKTLKALNEYTRQVKAIANDLLREGF